MSNYRSSKTPGGSYFFTVITYRRQPLLTLAESRAILRSMIRETRQNHPFAIDAWVLLPEHLHCIWTLPPVDTDYSTRWGISKYPPAKPGALVREPLKAAKGSLTRPQG